MQLRGQLCVYSSHQQHDSTVDRLHIQQPNIQFRQAANTGLLKQQTEMYPTSQLHITVCVQQQQHCMACSS